MFNKFWISKTQAFYPNKDKMKYMYQSTNLSINWSQFMISCLIKLRTYSKVVLSWVWNTSHKVMLVNSIWEVHQRIKWLLKVEVKLTIKFKQWVIYSKKN